MSLDKIRAACYRTLRAERPEIRAADVWDFLHCDGAVSNIDQFLCRHQWSHGYDDTDHEIPIHCELCGAPGDI